jgi:hypothetical protein
MKKIIAILIFITCAQYEINAQDQSEFNNDPYLPTRHKINAGIYTAYRGPSIAAPVIIGEITYGISNRFSASILGGTTGTLSLVGIRLAASVYQHRNFRLLSRLSIIYYLSARGLSFSTTLINVSHPGFFPWDFWMENGNSRMECACLREWDCLKHIVMRV